MIIGEMPKFLASDEAPKTNLSALHTKVTRERSKIRIWMVINGSYIERLNCRVLWLKNKEKLSKQGKKSKKNKFFKLSSLE